MRSLYIHIPFCSWVCHYCDFAKTANFDQGTTTRYLEWLTRELEHWLLKFSPNLETVFFGGGTPSILTHEYAPLMRTLLPYLTSGAEISLEANPEHITADSLSTWRALGFNRISLGVQTFSEQGLAFMTRKHLADHARRAIAACLAEFPFVNVDLIYGWPGQSRDTWESDLQQALALQVPHLSLYCLTFEPRTVIGRRQARGVIAGQDDNQLWTLYECARDLLGQHGFMHEEVSNWSLPGHTCEHNWTYWTDQHFIGVGVGAHGYIPHSALAIGRRYAYPRALPATGKTIDPEYDERSATDWLLEYLGSSLRTNRGTSLTHISSRTGLEFFPSMLIERGISEGALKVKEGQIYLTPAEWFRETSWGAELASCFK